MTLWPGVEGVILAAILLVCLVLAVRWVRRQIRGDGCGSACGGCTAGPKDCPMHRLIRKPDDPFARVGLMSGSGGGCEPDSLPWRGEGRGGVDIGNTRGPALQAPPARKKPTRPPPNLPPTGGGDGQRQPNRNGSNAGRMTEADRAAAPGRDFGSGCDGGPPGRS
jgi:hypothetical protein